MYRNVHTFSLTIFVNNERRTESVASDRKMFFKQEDLEILGSTRQGFVYTIYKR